MQKILMSLCQQKTVPRRVNSKIKIRIEEKQQILYLHIGSKLSSSYSYETVCEFYNALHLIQERIEKNKIKYVLLKLQYQSSRYVGSDMEFLMKCIKNNDKILLMDYAYKCVKIAYHLSSGFNTNAIIISFLNGNAFGGNFEYALASQYIVAEEHIKFGFPESGIGISPMMGAYHFLTRKVGFAKAKEIINTGLKWDVCQMKDLNVIDKVSKKAKGVETILELIERGCFIVEDRLQKNVCTISYEELLKSIDVWIEDVLTLNPAKVKAMENVLYVMSSN